MTPPKGYRLVKSGTVKKGDLTSHLGVSWIQVFRSIGSPIFSYPYCPYYARKITKRGKRK